MIKNINESSLGLYIHIPWCIKKCPYCDFNSHQINTQNSSYIPPELEQQYIEALILDLKQSLDITEHQSHQNITSIFIGGGTPSLFSAKSIESMLNQIQKITNFNNDIEITLEANPGSFESQKFYDFQLAGVNRLSIGVQSFNDHCLKELGRVHNAKQAKLALEHANQIGINFNIDLMHTLPKQNEQIAINDLQTAISFQPNHISWYQLTIEPNTKFAKHTPVLPTQKQEDCIYHNGLEILQDNNYNRYEISAYARIDEFTDNQAKHNLNYWRYGDYVGIGAGAHSKITKYDGVHRYWKQKSPVRYINKSINKISGSTTLNESELLLEYMMNKLRVLEPIKEEDLQIYTNKKFIDIKPQILQAKNNDWLKFQNNELVITDLGRMFLNDFILLFA